MGTTELTRSRVGALPERPLRLATMDEVRRYSAAGARERGLLPPMGGGAVSAYWYTKGIKHLLDGTIAWSTYGTVRCCLMGTATPYTPSQDSHEYYSDVSASELTTAGGYTAKGSALGGRSLTVDDATNETRLITTTNPSWTSASFTARYAVIYCDSNTASTSPLLGWVDFGANETVSSGSFTITWDATGVLWIAGSASP